MPGHCVSMQRKRKSDCGTIFETGNSVAGSSAVSFPLTGSLRTSHVSTPNSSLSWMEANTQKTRMPMLKEQGYSSAADSELSDTGTRTYSKTHRTFWKTFWLTWKCGNRFGSLTLTLSQGERERGFARNCVSRSRVTSPPGRGRSTAPGEGAKNVRFGKTSRAGCCVERITESGIASACCRKQIPPVALSKPSP